MFCWGFFCLFVYNYLMATTQDSGETQCIADRAAPLQRQTIPSGDVDLGHSSLHDQWAMDSP